MGTGRRNAKAGRLTDSITTGSAVTASDGHQEKDLNMPQQTANEIREAGSRPVGKAGFLLLIFTAAVRPWFDVEAPRYAHAPACPGSRGNPAQLRPAQRSTNCRHEHPTDRRRVKLPPLPHRESAPHRNAASDTESMMLVSAPWWGNRCRFANHFPVLPFGAAGFRVPAQGVG